MRIDIPTIIIRMKAPVKLGQNTSPFNVEEQLRSRQAGTESGPNEEIRK